MDTVKISGCQEFGGKEECTGGAQGDFFCCSETILYGTIMVDHVTIFLAKPTELTTLTVNPNVNYGLWVIMMFQGWFMDYNKCITLRQDVDGGGGYGCVGREEGIWALSVLST